MKTFPTGRHAPRHLALLAALALLAVPTDDALANEPFDEAGIFFELNATAGDVGVHVSLDAESWKSLRILDPRQREILEVEPEGSAKKIGLTELFFEGEEPSLRKVPFSRFLKLFPPGRYQFEGMTVGNEPLRSRDRLSEQLPCPVTVVSPGPTPPVPPEVVVIGWETVRGVYNPATKVCNHAVDVGLVGFQVIVEVVNEDAGILRHFVVELPADATELRVPGEFFGADAQVPGTEFKLEVLAIEDTGNKTITEGSFLVATP